MISSYVHDNVERGAVLIKYLMMLWSIDSLGVASLILFIYIPSSSSAPRLAYRFSLLNGMKRALKELIMQLTNGTVNRPQIFLCHLSPLNVA